MRVGLYGLPIQANPVQPALRNPVQPLSGLDQIADELPLNAVTHQGVLLTHQGIPFVFKGDQNVWN